MVTSDITIPFNEAFDLVEVFAGDLTAGTLAACAFPNNAGLAEASLVVAGVYAAGPDETTVTVTFPDSEIDGAGRYSITHDDGSGDPVSFLQGGTYYRDPAQKKCAV